MLGIRLVCSAFVLLLGLVTIYGFHGFQGFYVGFQGFQAGLQKFLVGFYVKSISGIKDI